MFDVDTFNITSLKKVFYYALLKIIQVHLDILYDIF